MNTRHLLLCLCLIGTSLSAFEPVFSTRVFADKSISKGSIKEGIKIANRGNADAVLALADCYEKGAGVPRDVKKAFEYANKAIANGDARGHFLLGNYYLRGLGVSKDISKAWGEFRLAAKANSSRGQYNLGWLYYSGLLPQGKDLVRAYRWVLVSTFSGNDFELEGMARKALRELETMMPPADVQAAQVKARAFVP